MKLIRRILRYVMLLAFIIVLGLAYYYRSLIFSEVINNYVDNTVNSVLVMANIVPEEADPTTGETQETQETQESQETQGIQETQEVSDCEILKEVAQATKTKVVKCECEVEISRLELVGDADVDQATDDQPVQIEAEELTPEADAGLTTDAEPELSVIEEQGVIQEQVEIEEQVFDTDVDQAAYGEPAQIETEEQTIETEVDQAIDEETEQSQTDEGSNIELALDDNSTQPHSELINQARLLHLTGNTSNAIELYRELGVLYPDDPNVFGELGNVFYLKGEWEQIHYLYLVIHGLSPDIAEKLRVQLES